MVEFDPHATQRDLAPSVAAELRATGFEDVREIGRGGFGVVYRCRQPSLDRTVAVKVLTSDLDSAARARFFREQQAMGRLSGHPNIVNILDVGTIGSGRPFIVMQYHPHDSLEARIHRDGPIGWHEALRLGIKIAGALETAHRLGILHRDVKPGNILFTDYGEPQLTDFGIARISGGFETATGSVTGSPAFTAPEVLKGEPPTAASDVYSLGATLFCAITGHAAFERRRGEHVVAQFLRITTQPTPELSGQGIPDDVRAAIERAMAGSVAERPASAEEFGEILRDAERHNNRSVDEMALPTDRGAELAADTPPDENSDAPAPDRSPLPGRDSLMPMPLAIRGNEGNLPLELTSFIGRRHELAEAKRLLSTSRLVTMTGIGGVGKTRLALRVATSVRRAFDDGVWLIELGGLGDPALLTDSVATAFGLRARSTHPPLMLLAEYLAERRLLLVLDNCEHLVEAVAALAGSLLRTCPDLRILATSREPLGIGGEVAMRVPPLGVPDPGRPPSQQNPPCYDAITLFAERARTAVPEFRLTDDNMAVITQICQRLDGLPLPIELAAVRLRAMSARQILDRLTDRYALLTGGNRGAPTRQQTLRLSIDWSYELCTPQEQQLWARLSVFAGGFELDAAEGVCDGDLGADELLDTVASLVDKSILIREEPGAVVRFRMLETLREYGREKIQDSDNHTALRRRHRDWYMYLVKRAEAEWISPRQMEWIARLHREQPNLREALEFCVTEPGEIEPGLHIASALYPFWFTRGLLSEGWHWFDRALAHQSGSPGQVRIRALCTQAVMAGLQGSLRAGKDLVAEANDLTDQLEAVEERAFISHANGYLALYGGDPAVAAHSFDLALDGFRGGGNPIQQIEALIGLGLARWLLGDTARSTASYEEALAITERCGESVYRTYSLWALGLAAWRQGDPERGTHLLEQGLRLTRQVDDPVSSSLCIDALGWIAADKHRERAAVLMGAARALRQSVVNPTDHIPGVTRYHEECERQTRRALGELAYEAAFQRGRALSFRDAVAYALGENPGTSPQDSVGTSTILTRREKQVAELVAAGMTNKAIAANLVISQRTAQGHVEHILVKLGFTSRTQIAAWVVEQGHDHER